MAGKKVRLRALKGRRAAETLCTGLIAQVATLGWSFVRMAEARAVEHLDASAVFPDTVQFVSRDRKMKRTGSIVGRG